MKRTQLRKIRIKKGIRQIDLAKKLRVNQSFISRVESGHSKPAEKTLKRWQKALGMSL